MNVEKIRNDIQAKAYPLKKSASEFEYKVNFFGKIISNRRKTKFTKRDVLNCDSVFLSNPDYKIEKLHFDGASLGFDWGRVLNTNKLNAEFRVFLTRYRRVNVLCSVYVRHKSGRQDVFVFRSVVE